jgi:hypothetical protein
MQHDIQVGDLVQYRDWKPGDLPIDSVPEDKRGWGKTGIVVGIEDWTQAGKRHPDCGILILDFNSDFTLAKASELRIIERAENLNSGSKTALWGMPPVHFEAAANMFP